MGRHVRYGAVLCLILAIYLLDGLEQNEWLDFITNFALLVVIALTVVDERNARWLRVGGLAASGVVLVATIAVLALDAGDGYRAAGLFATAALLLLALLTVLYHVLQENEVTLSIVMAAVLAYALVGMAAANTYNAIDLVTDSPFFAQGAQPRGDYSYFAFVTLTTLGYGDLSPGTELAKRLVVIEVFIGQVFLVVLVARLVSLWGPRRRRS